MNLYSKFRVLGYMLILFLLGATTVYSNDVHRHDGNVIGEFGEVHPFEAGEFFKRHHVAIQAGYYKAISDDLRLNELAIDFTDAALGIAEYRFSFTDKFDGVISNRAWVSSYSASGAELNLTSSFFGIGVRHHTPLPSNEKIRVYFQPMLYIVSEEIEGNRAGISLSASETGVGYGFAGGLDIQASNLISIPIELTYISATSEQNNMDDLSGFGISTGINFNFHTVNNNRHHTPHKATKIAPDKSIDHVIKGMDSKSSRISKLPESAPAQEKNEIDTKSSRSVRPPGAVSTEEKKRRVQSPAKRSVRDLLGGYIVAHDGQFLGKITTSEIDSNSILNEVGEYGSEVSSTSIFNDIGQYGSDISPISAFNDMAINPPQAYTADGEFLAYLTTNTIKLPRVDTRAFIGWLKSHK